MNNKLLKKIPKQKTKSLISPCKATANLITRFNLIIFIVTIAVILAATVLSLSKILYLPYEYSLNSNNTSNSTELNQTVIESIKTYQTSDINTADTSMPGGRINPFSE